MRIKSKVVLSIAACASATSLMALATPAQASTPGECKDRIDYVQSDLNVIYSQNGIGGGNPQQTYDSLTSKLQGAKTKINQKKNYDAYTKLTDFRNAVISMRDAAKPKISVANANILLDGTMVVAIAEGDDGAIQCVTLLP